MKERGSNLDQQVIAISHADDLEFANALKDEIETAYNPKKSKSTWSVP